MSTVSRLDGPTLVTRLSFTHLAEFLAINDATKRAFYEVECIRGNWSVRELKRQIASLYYERSGLSRDKSALSDLANEDAERRSAALDIRDPYVFEFLGLTPRDVMSESHLEDQLIDKLETEKNHALVEYAIAGMDNQLFVSKYLLELPKKETMKAFIEEQIKTIGVDA
jgi:hypothetical protein